MFNNHDQMGPRISFSSDFLDTSSQQLRTDLGGYKEAPVSSDFEFSVKDYSSRLRPADEIFFQGKMLPAVGGGNNSNDQARKLTLREELQAGDDRPARSSSGRWMERLGLKRSRRSRGSAAVGGKTDLETVDEETVHDSTITAGKKQQEVLYEGSQSCSRSSWMKTKSKDDQ